MNLRDNIKAIKKEVEKERADSTVEQCLTLIIDKFFHDGDVDDSVSLDAYYRDYIFDSDRPWDDNELSFKQRQFAHKEAKKRLEELCVKLRKFGFKCTAVAEYSKTTDNRQHVFHTPYISVKL